MPEPDFAAVLEVELKLRSTEQGGRSSAVRSGLRPLWRIHGDPPSALGGLCEVELLGAEELLPGRKGDALLKFARGAIDLSGVAPGTRIDLFDGPNFDLGLATVKAVRAKLP